MRAHFSQALLDDAGNVINIATVRVLQPGTTTQITDTLYQDGSTGATLANPFSITNGQVTFYLDAPQRVKIGVTANGLAEKFWDDVDVLSSGADSTHPGTASNTVQVGLNATAPISGATALGVAATTGGGQDAQGNPEGTDALAVGHSASATMNAATAVGANAQATGASGTAVGDSAVASSSSSTALGSTAQAAYDTSTAVGYGAATTKADQVMLGRSADTVEVPGSLVLHDASGARWQVIANTNGTLSLQPLV